MLVFLLSYEFKQQQENKRLLYYAACGFLILIFVVQDSSVSMDISEYMRQYAIIPGLSFSGMLKHKFEIGYVLLSWIVERIFVSERVLLLALSLIIMLPFCRSFEKETAHPMVALMAFLALGMYMHAIIFLRQLAAMAILTYSYRYIRERKLIPFLLVVLAAMSFHKVAMVFIPLYFIYNIPINKWLLLFCGVCAVILSFFGPQIIKLGIMLLYPKYGRKEIIAIGGYTLLALLWVVTLLSYWVFRNRMDDPNIRIPFLMILTAAMIQPVCFAYFWWLRVVLFFRIALVPMTAQLYVALFRTKEGNPALALLERFCPGLHRWILSIYDQKWFKIATLLLLFAVLYIWYLSELDNAVYVMAPIF